MIEEQQTNPSPIYPQLNRLPYVPRTRVPRKSQERPAASDPAFQNNSILPVKKQSAKLAPDSGAGGSGNDIQDQFNKIADSEITLMPGFRLLIYNALAAGKKTFNSIFSKVKAKITESSRYDAFNSVIAPFCLILDSL